MTVEVTRLPSGLSVITDRMAHLETASLGVWIASGSRNEKPDEHGISHLLEHMAFKGTKRRTARQIAELSRDTLFWHYPHYHHSRPSGAVRSRDWKLIEFFDTDAVELYRLTEDVGEATDLAGKYPQMATALR